MVRPIPFLLLIASLIGTAPDAFAQDASDAASRFSRLQEQLKGGDRVTVRLDDGMTVVGRFVAVSDRELILVTDGVRHPIPADQILRVRRRRNGVLLGTIIGAVAGVPFGLALRSYVHNEGGSEAGAVLFPIGVGAGAGLALDAVLATNRTVYVR